MRVIKLVVLMLGCLLAFEIVDAQPLVVQTAGYAGDGSGYNEAGDGFNILFSQTPQRGLTDTGAWLYFGRTSSSDQLLVNGWGNIPLSAVSASAEFVSVDIADARSIPDFYLTCLNNSTWEPAECPNPTAVKVKIEATRSSVTQMQGVQRQTSTYADGSSLQITRNGVSTNIAGIVLGNIAGLNVPVASPIVFMNGSLAKNSGITITFERTP